MSDPIPAAAFAAKQISAGYDRRTVVGAYKHDRVGEQRAQGEAARAPSILLTPSLNSYVGLVV